MNMDRVEDRGPEQTKLNEEFVVQNLGLVSGKDDSNFLRLTHPSKYPKEQATLERKPLEKLEEVLEYFEGIDLIDADPVCRPKGDTTFFTSAGVQHLETMLREKGELENNSFIVSQPVVRSQFMDKIEEGTSSSFINLSIVSVDASPDDFVKLTSEFIKLLTSLGIDDGDLRFRIEDKPDRWGNRKFTKTVLTIYLNDIELGESVYIHDYSAHDDKRVDIVDIGFGIERINWAIGTNTYYFSGFEKFYSQGDKDEIASIIDPLRTLVLIVGEGVKPSSHDHGYRIRQLSKRFVQRNILTQVDVVELLDRSLNFWVKWGYKPTVDKEQILEIIRQENDRNYNGLFLKTLLQEGERDLYVDINQPTQDFIKQIGFSLSKDEIDKIVKKMK